MSRCAHTDSFFFALPCSSHFSQTVRKVRNERGAWAHPPQEFGFMFPHLETRASVPKASHLGYADGLSEPIRCERSVIGKRAARRVKRGH